MEFTEDIVQQVWEKAREMPDREKVRPGSGRETGLGHAGEWRKDECGAWINRKQYGHTASGYGWKIENTSPGKPDDPEHLRPFHCDNPFERAAGQPHCHVTADREAVEPTARIDSPRNRSLD